MSERDRAWSRIRIAPSGECEGAAFAAARSSSRPYAAAFAKSCSTSSRRQGPSSPARSRLPPSCVPRSWRESPTWFDSVVGTWEAPGLGRIELRRGPRGPLLDAGEWTAKVGQKTRRDGTNALVVMDVPTVPLADFELVPRAEGDQLVLLAVERQHTYVFERRWAPFPSGVFVSPALAEDPPSEHTYAQRASFARAGGTVIDFRASPKRSSSDTRRFAEIRASRPEPPTLGW